MFSTLRQLSDGKKQFIRGVCFLVPFYLWASVFIHGAMRWPHLPIREEAGRFVDKAGNAFTLQDYAAFQKWESGVFTRFGFLVALGCVAVASWILGLPLWSPSPSDELTSASVGFRRLFPKLMIGVSLVVFSLLVWNLYGR